jgi:hypothetical protein
LGILSVLASGISNTTYAKNKIIAGYLAQEGIEYIRNMRDTCVISDQINGWSNFNSKLSSCLGSSASCSFDNTKNPSFSSVFSACGSSPYTSCLLYLSNGNYNIDNIGGTGVNSGFIRKVWMTTTSNSDEVRIFSEVDWKQGSGNYSVTFSDNLYNWMQ